MDTEARIRGMFECFNAGDVEGMAALCHPDVVVIDAPDLPGTRTYRGRDELVAELHNLKEMFQNPQATIDEIRIGDDRALALFHVLGHGQGSGVPINPEIAYVFTLDGGEITQIRIFLDHATGLEAAGL
jgi:ketosteroid isomerase-like protein